MRALGRGVDDPAPGAGAAGAGDCIWYFNGNVFKGVEIPRLTWVPGSTGATDYLGNGASIFEFVVHSDGTILGAQPHLRTGKGSFARLNRNPGNITAGGGDYGQYAGNAIWHNFMIFPRHDLGFAAIGTLLRGPGYRNFSILQAFQRYAPTGDGGNNPAQYASMSRWAAMGPSAVPRTEFDGRE